MNARFAVMFGALLVLVAASLMAFPQHLNEQPVVVTESPVWSSVPLLVAQGRIDVLEDRVTKLRKQLKVARESARSWRKYGRLKQRQLKALQRQLRGSEVVALACRHLGKPYVYGAAGPSSFDCSGLVMCVYGQVGIKLAHGATAQQRASRRIPLSKLRPGDLVFYGSASYSYHVAIYVGAGRIIESSSGGVSYSPMRSPWTGGTFFH